MAGAGSAIASDNRGAGGRPARATGSEEPLKPLWLHTVGNDMDPALPAPSSDHNHGNNNNNNSGSNSSSSHFIRRPSFFGGRSSRHHPKPPPPTPPPPNTNTNTNTNTLVHPRQPTPATPPRHRHGASLSRHSIASSVSDLGAQLRRSHSASLRSSASPAAAHHRRTTSSTLALAASPLKATVPAPDTTNTTTPASPPAPRPALAISTLSRPKPRSADHVTHGYDKSPLSAHDRPKTPFGTMATPMPLRHPTTQKDMLHAAHHLPGPAGATPNLVFQHIHDLASKRISTLDYLRKAHEGRIYWFNTLLFAKADLARLPSFTHRNQARRATHYLLLGFSLPTILDLNANSPADYLKALNALLLEFEQYQSIHPADGTGPSTLSRARIPQMFKRANLNMTSKGRRTSSAASDFPTLTPTTTATMATSSNHSTSSFHSDMGALDPASLPDADLLLPNESYIHLQTPSLPFDPDFYNTFATLCDVLIDCYTRILSMLSTPESVVAAGGGVPGIVGDLFTKADARVRKIILAGVVREFEDGCRAGLKSEVGGVGKVVLGGLM